MKKKLFKIASLFLFIVASFNSYSQTDGLSYQAVILDPSSDKLELPGVDDPYAFLIDKPLGIRFTITNSSGVIEYQEAHATKTDNFGTVNLIIGNGSPSIGSFTEIFWDGKPKDLLVEVKIESSFENLSNQELLFVPYALHRELIATKSTNLYDSLIVNSGSPSLLSGLLTVDGVTNLNDNFYVNNASLTSLSGDLIVDGTSNLNSSLTVNNSAPSLLTGDLTVNGATNLLGGLAVGGNLTVIGTTDLRDTLTVSNGSPTRLTGNLVVDGTSDLNGSLSVNNASPSTLTGNLIVDGTSNLNSALSVNNASPTLLTGALTTNGVTNLNSAFYVNNASLSSLTGNLIVDGTSNLNSSLTVNNASPTLLSGALTVNGVTNLNNTFNVNNSRPSNLSGTLLVVGTSNLQDDVQVGGQVTIRANLPGGDANYAAYPLRVEGSGQGVAIKLNVGTANNSNNFITFFNSSNNPVGRIEGQTTSEVTSSPQYIFTNSILVAEEVTAIAKVAASFTPVTVGGIGVSSGPCISCIVSAAADLVLKTANLAAYNVFALSNLGVTYESGSADYAEWLERSIPNERILPGDIVGVRAGKISKVTENASQLMVISTKPAILGNMPEEGKAHLYNKVAFMGQIPVKVKGIVLSGDYILPSGDNDGLGIAVSPDKITAKQYKQVVGIAWSESFMGEDGFSVINMAIGLNSNAISEFVEKQEERILELESKFTSLENRLIALEGGVVEQGVEVTKVLEKEDGVVEKDLSREELIVQNMPAELSDEVMQEAISNLKKSYEAIGFDVTQHEGLNRLFNDLEYQKLIIIKTQENYKKMYKSLVK